MRLGRASAYGMLAMLSIASTSLKTARRSSSRGGSRNGGAGGNGHHHRPQARAKQIAQSTGIPVEYLRKVLQRLSRARLIDSERGRGGGFRLAKHPAKITLLNIVEAIEGPVDEIAFMGDRLLSGTRSFREWRKHTALGVRELLDAQSLADLME